MKNVFLIHFAVLAIALGGCGRVTLEPGSVYGDDVALYQVEKEVPRWTSTVDAFLKLEFDNRDTLAAIPQIRQAADKMRAEVPGIVTTINTGRDEYVAAKNAFKAAVTEAERAAAAANLSAEQTKLLKNLTLLQTASDIAADLILRHRST